ncbi:MAG: hypothetical protein KY453_03390 [Gemmatimonadetes bacterium]|nr:hypothetical protein [Gemmatimonadota bacterium]
MTASSRQRRDDRTGGEETAERPRLRDLGPGARALAVAFFLVLPVAVLTAAEAGLRLAGYGHAYRTFLPVEGAPEYLEPDPSLGRPYFPDPADARRPHRDLILREKTGETFRVFVQGASTAAGFPYYFGGAFSRMLRQRLRETFPARRIEVVNVALDATNSYALLDMARRLVAWEPDAVLLYAGHNEYYGTYGVASTVSVARAPGAVRAYLALKRLRLVQLLDAAVARARAVLAAETSGDGGAAPAATLMERLAAERTLRADSPLHDAALGQLRSNLGRTLALYAEAGVPVFVATVASNERDQPPFVSEPHPGVDRTAWERQSRAARRAAAVGDTAAALAAARRLRAVDSLAPWPHYLEGRLLDVPATRPAAVASYRRARDLDQLPFRAPSAINRVLREEAARRGAVVVDAEERLAAASPGGVVGADLMLEHLHPNLEGQLLLADAFYEALKEAGLPERFPRTVPLEDARARRPVTAVDSLAGAYWITRLTAGWPFRPAGPPPVVVPDTLRSADPVEALALSLYRRELTWPEATRHLYFVQRERGSHERALHTARVLVDELPLWAGGHLYAGEASLLLDRPEVAREYLWEAQARQETAWAARILAGLAAERDQRGEALRHLRTAARLSGDAADRTAIRAYEAIPELERRAERAPDAALWADLAGAYLLTGQRGRARRAAERALALAPGSGEAETLLRRASAGPPLLPPPRSGAGPTGPPPAG